MRALAVDTWAFLEMYLEGPRCEEVVDEVAGADVLFTVRDVVAETFNFVVRRTKSTEAAWTWWNALEETPLRVHEPGLAEVREFMGHLPRRGALSFTDHALALVAQREHCGDVASADAEFRKFGLDPVFARR